MNGVFPVTRLQVLCALHGFQGGTIHQFNERWKVDFLSMSDDDFKKWVAGLSTCCDCAGDGEKPDGSACQQCCEHNEHDHYICLDCGHEGEPSDYHDEDYGQER